MTTAIQDTIVSIDKRLNEFSSVPKTFEVTMLTQELKWIKSVLIENFKKEKEQIIDAYEAAMERPIDNYAEAYYNMNYNQTFDFQMPEKEIEARNIIQDLKDRHEKD